VQGVRTLFGFGRPARAKALPVFVLVFSCLPAVISVFIASETGMPIRHSAYFAGVSILYVLFSAAQTPELFSRDQANRVLPLVFSRDLSRWQYASARLLSVMVALFAMMIVPQLVLWLGGIGMAADTVAVFKERWQVIGPILAVSTLGGVMLGTIASAISFMTPRRHLATAAIVGLFIVLGASTTALGSTSVVDAKTSQLFNPIVVLDLANRMLFDEPSRMATRAAANPLSVYIGMIALYSALSLAVVWWRSQKVDA
jgi:ABC-2 type transport system permease protein